MQLNIRDHVITQLTKKSKDIPFSPMVKMIKPYEDFKSFVKHSQLDLNKVDPNKLKFWSDVHFGHTNIIKYCDRPFNSAAEMDAMLIQNYVDNVEVDDVVVWVGDVSFSSPTKINQEYLPSLPGYKILIMGNHDFDNHDKRPIHYDFDEIHLCSSVRNFAISHHPWWDIPDGWFHIHGHIHNKVILNSIRHINVSVEQIDYKPISFATILERL